VRRVSASVVSRLTLRVTNTDDSALTPHFMLTTGASLRQYWSIVRGPGTLPAHATARYELRPPRGRFALPGRHTRVRVRVFTPTPQTLSSMDVQLSASTAGARARQAG